MNKKISLPELRKHARVALSINYDLILNEQRYRGETGDISLGGASLVTCAPDIPKDQARQEGKIILSLADERLNIDCMIVYVGNPKIPSLSKTGITFKNLSAGDSDSLLKFMMKSL